MNVCLSGAPDYAIVTMARECHKARDHKTSQYNLSHFLNHSSNHSGIGPTMATSQNDTISNEERKDICVELESFRQDTLALRTEAYRLRTAGRLDATANERLRTQQKELECCGEAIIKRCVHFSC